MKIYNKDDFTDKLNNANWSDLYLCRNVNYAWRIFQEIFMSILDDIAPTKEIKTKQKTEPWITSEILDQIRDSFLYLYKKTQSKHFYYDYCKIRNKLQRDIKKVKSEYFSCKIEENKNNPKKLWEQLKSLGYNTKQKRKRKDCPGYR
jgi:hypothetical protein